MCSFIAHTFQKLQSNLCDLSILFGLLIHSRHRNLHHIQLHCVSKWGKNLCQLLLLQLLSWIHTPWAKNRFILNFYQKGNILQKEYFLFSKREMTLMTDVEPKMMVNGQSAKWKFFWRALEVWMSFKDISPQIRGQTS